MLLSSITIKSIQIIHLIGLLILFFYVSKFIWQKKLSLEYNISFKMEPNCDNCSRKFQLRNSEFIQAVFVYSKNVRVIMQYYSSRHSEVCASLINAVACNHSWLFQQF